MFWSPQKPGQVSGPPAGSEVVRKGPGYWYFSSVYDTWYLGNSSHLSEPLFVVCLPLLRPWPPRKHQCCAEVKSRAFSTPE